MAIITIKGWYQIDYEISNKFTEIKSTLLGINEMFLKLESVGIVERWFFLYENDTIRVRIKSKTEKKLKKKLDDLSSNKGLTQSNKLVFSTYQESDETMFSESVATAFAEIMSEVTKLTVAKLRKGLSFDNYRVLERLQHCMFNNLLTLGGKSEEYFLINRLHERIGRSGDKDFENKV